MATDLSTAGIPKVAARTRLSATTEAIRHIVLDGILPSGSRVKDQDLASALGVSRATVREAVRELVHEGLLVHEPYKGLRLAVLDDESIMQLAEVRVALETLAAQRVATTFDQRVRAELHHELDTLEQARASADAASINKAHIAFHRHILLLAGNPILAQVWDVIEQRARLFVRIDLETRPDYDRIVHDHREMVEVIETGEAVRIAEHVTAHILRSAEETVRARHDMFLATGVDRAKRGQALQHRASPAT